MSVKKYMQKKSKKKKQLDKHTQNITTKAHNEKIPSRKHTLKKK